MKKIIVYALVVLVLGAGTAFLYSCGGGGGGDDAVDLDMDGYDSTVDCDDNASSCTDDCVSDVDGDGILDCMDLCLDSDEDGYGTDNSLSVIGSGSEDVGSCTSDGTTLCTEGGASCLGLDCDDDPSTGASFNPGISEVCDDWFDNDCDDLVDCYDPFCASGCTTCTDDDSDGYFAVDLACSGGNDCADADSQVNPGVNADGDAFHACEDCDDSNPGIGSGTSEVCNGTDDDCDRLTDEDFTDLGDSCSSGTGICSRDGNMVCTGDETGTVCDAVPGSPTTETCNGLDDDCDGQSDEDFTDLGDACVSGVGACQRSGNMICTGDETGTVCDAVPGSPTTETCNGLDDDCDGQSDEDFTDADGDGYGACASVDCDDSDPDVHPGAAETCNGVDDDCDDEVDETFSGLNDVCYAGTGACQGAGQMVCNQTGDDTECDANVGDPVSETCNGLDDDCDGSTDEGDPGGGGSCTTGQPGVCSAGTLTCLSGSIQCSQDTASSTEVCNGLDDDCDNLTDEGGSTICLPFGSNVALETCSSEQCGIISCDSGWYDCNATYSDGCESVVTCP